MVDLFIATLCLINVGITLFGFIEKHTLKEHTIDLHVIVTIRNTFLPQTGTGQ